MPMENGFVSVGGRQVRYRRLGVGPMVLLIHGSPQSGRAVVPLMERLAAKGCSALAFDNPGNGLSDPLDGLPQDAQLYAQAIAETLDSLKIGRIAVYGFHTGAAFAALLASARPQQISGLVLEGLPVWTQAERDDILAHYLPPLTPSWDGSHMAWAWSRMEEQSFFFPWYRHDRASYLSHGQADFTHIHANAMDFMSAGLKADATYASAFRFDGGVAAGLAVPTRLCCAPSDPLTAHMDRLVWPANVMVDVLSPEPALALDQKANWLCDYANDIWPEFSPNRSNRFDFCEGPFGPAFLVRGSASAKGARLVPIGGSARRAPPPLPDEVLIELPGHGQSAGPNMALTSRRQLVTAIDDIVTIAGLSGSGEALIDSLEVSPSCPPDVSPRWDGTHLLTAWRYARRSALFHTWDAPHSRQAKPDAFPVDLNALQNQALDLLEADFHAPSIWRALSQA